MIRILLLAVVPFMTQHRNIVPKTEVSTNFYGSVTGIVDNAYIQAHGGGVDTNAVIDIANATIATNPVVVGKLDKTDGIGSISWNNGSLDANAATVSCGGGFTTPYDFQIKESPSAQPTHALSAKANRAESGHADEIATLDADGNPTRSGIAKANVATKTDLEGYLPLTGGDLTGNLYGFGASLGDGSLYLGNGMIYPYADPRSSFGPPMIANTGSGFILYHSDDIPGNPTWHYGQTPSADNEIAVKGDLDNYLPLTGGELSGGVYAQQAIASATTVGAQTIDAWADIRLGSETYYLHNEDECLADYNGKFAHESMISAADPTFSNAVLSVGINTNLVASIGELNDFIHGYGELGATSVGGLILALLGAAALLRKKTAKLDNSGNATDAFATDLLGKQVANAKVRYALATASSAAMVDRTVNLLTMTADETIVFPTATTHDGKTYARDFLLKLAYTAGTMTLPTGVTKVGDELSFTAGKTYLLAFTEIAANQFYVRSIEIA